VGVVEVEEEKPIAAIENEVFFAEGDDESDAAAA